MNAGRDGSDAEYPGGAASSGGREPDLRHARCCSSVRVEEEVGAGGFDFREVVGQGWGGLMPVSRRNQ